jgi:hypothetical protein
MALAADGETHLRRLTALRVGDRQLLMSASHLSKVLGGSSGFEARLLEHVDVDVHLLEVAVLDRDPVAHALPLADLGHVLRQFSS